MATVKPAKEKKRVLRYYVCSGTTLDALQKHVADVMSDNLPDLYWKPKGGVASTETDRNRFFYQGMVLKGKVPNK